MTSFEIVTSLAPISIMRPGISCLSLFIPPRFHPRLDWCCVLFFCFASLTCVTSGGDATPTPWHVSADGVKVVDDGSHVTKNPGRPTGVGGARDTGGAGGRQKGAVFVTEPKKIEMFVGETLLLHCKVNDASKKSFSWHRNGRLLVVGGRPVTSDARVSASNRDNSSDLLLQDLRLGDEGLFTCSVKEEGGTEKTSLTHFVKVIGDRDLFTRRRFSDPNAAASRLGGHRKKRTPDTGNREGNTGNREGNAGNRAGNTGNEKPSTGNQKSKNGSPKPNTENRPSAVIKPEANPSGWTHDSGTSLQAKVAWRSVEFNVDQNHGEKVNDVTKENPEPKKPSTSTSTDIETDIERDQLLPAGDQLHPAGDQLLPAGDQLHPAGDQLLSAGQQLLPAGQQPPPAGDPIPPPAHQQLPTKVTDNRVLGTWLMDQSLPKQGSTLPKQGDTQNHVHRRHKRQAIEEGSGALEGSGDADGDTGAAAVALTLSDACNGHACTLGGSCEALSLDEYRCACRQGFKGVFCETDCNACPSNFLYDHMNGGCYAFQAADMTWHDAQHGCKSADPLADLVSIESSQEYWFLDYTMKRLTSSHQWRRLTATPYFWSSGTDFAGDFSWHWHWQWYYLRDSLPNREIPEHPKACLILTMNGWQLCDCAVRAPFICERPHNMWVAACNDALPESQRRVKAGWAAAG